MIKQYVLRAIIVTNLIFVSFSLPALGDEYLTVIKDKVNIRATPSTQAEIYWEVFKGFPLQVLAKKGQWSKVADYEGDQGWIHSALLSTEKSVIVKATTVNMRSGPGLNHEIIATVKSGVILKPIYAKKGWVKVEHEGGSSGWIQESFIWPTKF